MRQEVVWAHLPRHERRVDTLSDFNNTTASSTNNGVNLGYDGVQEHVCSDVEWTRGFYSSRRSLAVTHQSR